MKLRFPALVLGLVPTTVASQGEVRPPNVLFVYVEDMTRELGTFGHPVVRTPNLDALAADGVVFDSAYCPAPICNPSRIGTMTGMRASTTGFTRNEEPFHETSLLGVPILPLRFKQAGYSTGGTGKIFHRAYEHPGGVWDVYESTVRDSGVPAPTNPDPAAPSRPIFWGPYLNGPDGSLGSLDDTHSSNAAMQMMDTLPEPWFIAVGYRAPHLPFVYPEAFHGIYDPNADVPPLPAEEGGPWKSLVANDTWQNPFHYLDPAWAATPETARREATVAYWRCATYIDSELGRVMEYLTERSMRDRTIVVFVSDHGWSMGVHCRYAKQALWDEVARVPLVVSVPGALGNGRVSERPVELVDLYPTLMDYCGITPPAGLDGLSLRPLLEDPTAPFRPAFAVDERWNSTRWNRMVRTDQYKFVYDERGTHQLYDLDADPGEYVNLYGDPQFAAIASQHEALLMQNGLLQASWNNYFDGTPGTNGIPTFTASAPPLPDALIDIHAGNAAGIDVPALLVLGSFGANQILDSVGGRLVAQPQITAPFTLPAGGLTIPLLVPPLSAAGSVGTRYAMQLIHFDPGAANAVAFSRGLRLFVFPQ